MHIIGHRGARGEAPENTLGGFTYLKQIAIHAVEFDVRQLIDQQLIVIHDDNLKRTARINKAVHHVLTTDLNTHDHRSSWPDWSAAEPTPTLKQVLAIIQDFKHIEVEIKAVESDTAAHVLIDHLLPLLSGFEQHAVITSFDEKILTALNEKHTTFKKGLLIESKPEHAISLAKQLNCQQIGWMNELATPERIKDTHEAQLKTSVWTVNDIQRAKELYDLGIHGLITDYPLKMKNYFKF